MKERKNERKFLKRKKLKIVAGIFIYLIIVSLFFLVYDSYKLSLYDEKKLDKIEYISEEICYNGLENLDCKDVEIYSDNENINVGYLMNNGLKSIDYNDIKLNIKMDDMNIFCNKGKIYFEFKNFKFKEEILSFFNGGSLLNSYDIEEESIINNENIIINYLVFLYACTFFIFFSLLIILFILVAIILIWTILVEPIILYFKKRKIKNKNRK